MEQDSPLIAIIVISIGLAFLLGTLANRLRISPIAGYLLAGVAVGPATSNYAIDPGVAPQLAEFGIILLMFGVGLSFTLRDLLARWAVVVPGALFQIAASTALGIAVAEFLDWPFGAAFALGLSLSISSTVVLTRALEARHLIDTDRGHIAVGWLIVQDLFTVLALVLLPPLALALQAGTIEAGGGLEALGQALGYTILSLVGFIALMLIVGRRIIPVILHYTAHTGSRELFRLAVLAVALVVAFLASELFGVSLALGAFFAGMILTESELSQRAAEESLPLRDAFAVLFFVSIGMLFDPMVVVRDPVLLLAAVMVVLVGNGGVSYVMVRLSGYPVGTALIVGASLAQIGEFSFVLVDLSVGLDLLDERARDIVLGASIISIFINPALYAVAERLRRKLEPAPILEEPLEAPARGAVTEGLVTSVLRNHAVLVGYGRVGQLVADSLLREGWPLLVIESATDLVERLHEKKIEVIAGNAAEDSVLDAANLAAARVLIVAIPNGFEAGQVVEQARAASPTLEILARAHFDAEVDHLLEYGANTVIMGEREIARSMLERARESKHANADAFPPPGQEEQSETPNP